jgi:hypothetical protein
MDAKPTPEGQLKILSNPDAPPEVKARAKAWLDANGVHSPEKPSFEQESEAIDRRMTEEKDKLSAENAVARAAREAELQKLTSERKAARAQGDVGTFGSDPQARDEYRAVGPMGVSLPPFPTHGDRATIDRMAELGDTEAQAHQQARRREHAIVGATAAAALPEFMGPLAALGPVLGTAVRSGVGGSAGSYLQHKLEGSPNAGTGAAEAAILSGLLGGLGGLGVKAARGLRNSAKYGDDVAQLEETGGKLTVLGGPKAPPGAEGIPEQGIVSKALGIQAPEPMPGVSKGPKMTREMAGRHAPEIMDRIIKTGDESQAISKAADARFFASPAAQVRVPRQELLDAIDEEISNNLADGVVVRDKGLASKLNDYRDIVSKADIADMDAARLQQLTDDAKGFAGGFEGEKNTKAAEAFRRLYGKTAEMRHNWGPRSGPPQMQGGKINWPTSEFDDLKAAESKAISEDKNLKQFFNVPTGNMPADQIADSRQKMELLKDALENIGSATRPQSDPVLMKFLKENPEIVAAIDEIRGTNAAARLSGHAPPPVQLQANTVMGPKLSVNPSSARLRIDPLLESLGISQHGAQAWIAGAAGVPLENAGHRSPPSTAPVGAKPLVAPGEIRALLDALFHQPGASPQPQSEAR